MMSENKKYCLDCNVELNDLNQKSYNIKRNYKVCISCAKIRSKKKSDKKKNDPKNNTPEILEQKRVERTIRVNRFKKEVLEQYGGCQCVCCPENNFEFLTIDHKEGGGNEHRRKLKEEGYLTIYGYLIENNYPDKDKYQVKCLNCNAAAGLWGICPHEEERKIKDFKNKSLKWFKR
jgi:hypothetical protein